jgi:hypothetical protein
MTGGSGAGPAVGLRGACAARGAGSGWCVGRVGAGCGVFVAVEVRNWRPSRRCATPPRSHAGPAKIGRWGQGPLGGPTRDARQKPLDSHRPATPTPQSGEGRLRSSRFWGSGDGADAGDGASDLGGGGAPVCARESRGGVVGVRTPTARRRRPGRPGKVVVVVAAAWAAFAAASAASTACGGRQFAPQIGRDGAA